MTEHDIYPVMLAAGFDALHAETFTALALRESGGDPNAHNGDASTGDDSYGLLQINWKVDSIRNLCLRNGVTDPAMLKDPATNAKIAFLMFAGSDRNLSIGWYIDVPGMPPHTNRSYQQRYEAHLPAAHAAALAYHA